MASDINVDAIMATIRKRESGGNYRALNFAWNSGGSTASGAYQFTGPTWRGLTRKFGTGTEYNFAYEAPPAVQDKIARLYINDILRRSNGNLAAVPNEWYTGNIQGNISAKALKVNRGITPQQYTAKWINDYNKINGTQVTNVAPNSDGSVTLRDANGQVVDNISAVDAVAPPPSIHTPYTGEEQSSLITSMNQLEFTESNWEPNVLDEYSNFIYNLELFLVDQEDVEEFMNTSPDIIENDGWPGTGTKKVVVAKTGETAEFFITDLVIDSVGVSSSEQKNLILANAATTLSFNITRVGNARLADGLQDAIALAGYMDIATAIFFVKVKFTRIDENGNASSIPNTTKVIPFVISKLMDISTSTDQRGTSATLEGVVLRKYAVTNKAIGQIKYKITSPVVQENANDTINEFMNKLNEEIVKNSYGIDDKFNLTYKYVPDPFFNQVYSNLSMSDLYGTGPRGAEVDTAANPTNSTISVAKKTLEVQPTTNVIDVIKDVLLKTDSIRDALINPKNTFTDLFSIEVDYKPKKDGYNVLTKTQGAEITYTVCIKQELIEQNTLNQTEQLSNVVQILNTAVSSGRLKKKYYYYYTGENDQIMQFDISLNNQLIKVENEEYGVFYNVNQINSIEETLTNLRSISQRDLQILQQAHTDAASDAANAEALLKDLNAQYASIIQQVKNDFVDRIIAQSGQGPGGEGGSSSIAAIVNSHFNDLTTVDDLTLFEARFREIENEFGLSEGTVYTEEVQKSLTDLIDTITNVRNDLINAQKRLSDVNARAFENQQTVAGSILSDRLAEFGLNDTTQTFARAGIAENIATIEDLGTDLRRKLTPVEVAGILNLLAMGAARFVSEEMAAITDQTPTVELITRNDQQRSKLVNVKFMEGWSCDYSMINATMKIKGDPYWVQNYMTTQKRNETYGQQNYRPFNHSTAIGQNMIMVITNTLDGVTFDDQPIISNLFRYLYVIKSIKSEFSSGLFTQTFDMVKFILTDVFEEKGQNDSSTNAAGQQINDNLLNEEKQAAAVPVGNTITVDELTSSIANDNGNIIINGFSIGDIRQIIAVFTNLKTRNEQLFFEADGVTERVMTPEEQQEYDKNEKNISEIYSAIPDIDAIIVRLANGDIQ